MNINEKMTMLKNAYAQGFISKEDFESRLASLSTAAKEVVNTTTMDKAGQFVERVMESNALNEAAGEARQMMKRALQTDMAADMATGAAGGAIIASVVPIIGTGAGAVVGAAFGAYKHLTKK